MLPHFPQVSPRTWEHPQEATALALMRSIPGLDVAIGRTLGRINEQINGLRLLRDAVQATPTTYPGLLQRWTEVCHALDADPRIPVYVRPMGGVNAITIGMDTPSVIVSREANDQLTAPALRVVLGHELGHILSGHIRYRTAASVFTAMGASTLSLGLAAPLYVSSIAAMRAWERASELSADRAALLATGDLNTSIQLVGIPEGEGWTPNDETWGPLAGVVRKGQAWSRSHPRPVERVDALLAWAGSEEHNAILAGDWPLRGEEQAESREWLRDQSQRAVSFAKNRLATLSDSWTTGGGSTPR